MAEHGVTGARGILVLEDDAELRGLICRWLERRGFVVRGAADAQQAHQHALRQRFDAVILDRTLPGSDGLRVGRELRLEQPWLQVVVLSGHGDAESQAAAQSLGCAAFFTKPVRLRELETALLRAWGDAPRVDDEHVLTTSGAR